ncbi:MAG TPA: TerB family tellurite resistance protein [Sandaracinaceae bacterium LLY-WYZ-13_1]|nr:TerB family tellurite resistance protein [Sandaracinaceae bacterium LLY-WYZ-13_1]
MQEHQEAMVKSLVAVAWADGRMDGEETEVIEALLSAFEIEGDDAESIRQFAKEPKALDDVPLTELSASDRRLLLQHAVILTYIDGTQSEDEVKVLEQLVDRLRIPETEAKVLLEASEQRAKRLLDLL